MTKRTRRRARVASGIQGAIDAPGELVRVDLVTFGAVSLEVLTTPWLLERCSTERGWQWVGMVDEEGRQGS